MCAATVAGALPSASGQTLQDVLSRIAVFLARSERDLSGVVMEEQYRQEIHRSRGTLSQYRDLRSDVLMVWVPEDRAWLMFRDVFEVDGKIVRDRQQRLERLFLGPAETVASRAKEIVAESARFHIGDIQRNLNLPTVALLFLHPVEAGRVKFVKTGEGLLGETNV